MAYKRRRSRRPMRRRMKRRRTSYRRRRSFRRSRASNQVHTFKIRKSTTAINSSNTSGTLTRDWVFKINDITNYTDYQGMYDQFRLNRVKVEFRIVQQPGAYTATTALPILYYMVDKTGCANALAGISNLLEYPQTKVIYFNDRKMYHKVYFRPGTLIGMLNKDTTTNPPTISIGGDAKSGPKWFDFENSLGIPHYGMKTAIVGAGLGVNVPQIDCWITYYFQCRGQK